MVRKSIISFFDGVSGATSPEKIAFGILLGVLFLTPLFLVPAGAIPFVLGKNLIIFVGTALALVFFLVHLLKKGEISVPIEYMFIALGVIPVIYGISAALSGSPAKGILGDMMSTQTLIFVLVMGVLFLLTMFLFQDKNRIFYSYLIFFTAAFLIAVYQIVKLVLGDWVSFGTLVAPTSNLIGSWKDFGAVMGAVTLLSLMTLEMLPMGRGFNIALYTALGVSFIFLILVNFSLIWILLSVFSLLFFVYIFSLDKANQNTLDSEEKDLIKRLKKGKSTTYILTLVILSASVIFLTSNELGSYVARAVGTIDMQVTPSWAIVAEVARDSVAENPVFGSGPNQYISQWLKHKPLLVNQTPFWHLEFNSAGGNLLTSLVSVGLLGFLAWLAFLGLYLWIGFKVIFTHVTGHATRYLVTSSFVISLFLWVIFVFSSPGPVVVMLTFFFSGLFLASALEAGALQTKTFGLFTQPRISFVSVMVLVLLLIVSGVFAYSSLKTTVASAYYQKGVRIFNTTGNVLKAEEAIGRAIRIRRTDDYYRTLAELNQFELNRLLLTEVGAITPEELQRDVQIVIGKGVRNANTAIALDRNEYRNWMTFGQINHSLVPLGFEGSYENAAQSYDEAIKRNPTSPALLLTRAQLERARGNNDGARSYIAQALALKNNYTDARFVLAQIAIEENNVSQAIQSLNAAAVVDPNNPTLFFQLGVLYYENEDWQNAISAFGRAISLAGEYGNARYFLGLSFAEDGERSKAVEQFEILVDSNPGNDELKKILSNLRLGRRALYGIEQAPVQRETLPVDEDEIEGDLDTDEVSTSTPEIEE